MGCQTNANCERAGFVCQDRTPEGEQFALADDETCDANNICLCVPAADCIDIDECAANESPCGEGSECVNTLGGFECECAAGFEANDDGVCVDIDECADPDVKCDVNARCQNTDGGYECICNPGFQGDGRSCCPENPAGGYSPCGPQTEVDVAVVENGGWNRCYLGLYDAGLEPDTIVQSCGGDDLMLACRPVGSNQLTLLAWAPKDDVLRDTGRPGTQVDENVDITTVSNGSEWYYGLRAAGSRGSIGFFRAGDDARKNTCDPLTTGSAEQRLCWHVGNGIAIGGYRCGETQGLNESRAWERLMFTR